MCRQVADNVCKHCGYYGNTAETHALFAVLEGDRVHAMALVEDWNSRERRETCAALIDLFAMVNEP